MLGVHPANDAIYLRSRFTSGDFDGRNQPWNARLTGHVNFIKGLYKNNDGQHATCRFSGPRL